MVQCVCGKSIEKVPNWLGSVSIQFICQNCPNRTVKSIADVTLAPIAQEPDTGMGKLEAELAAEDADEDEA